MPPHDYELEAITRALKCYRWDRQYKVKSNRVGLAAIAGFIGCSKSMLYQLTNGRWGLWGRGAKPSKEYKARLRSVIDLIEQRGLRFPGGKPTLPGGQEIRFPLSMRPQRRAPYPKKWQGPVMYVNTKTRKRKGLKRGPKLCYEKLCPTCCKKAHAHQNVHLS